MVGSPLLWLIVRREAETSKRKGPLAVEEPRARSSVVEVKYVVAPPSVKSPPVIQERTLEPLVERTCPLFPSADGNPYSIPLNEVEAFKKVAMPVTARVEDNVAAPVTDNVVDICAAPVMSRATEGFVVPIPTLPAALIVMPEEVALKFPPGVILNLFASELSKPRYHTLVPESVSWNWSIGSPCDVWRIERVLVAIGVWNMELVGIESTIVLPAPLSVIVIWFDVPVSTLSSVKEEFVDNVTYVASLTPA